MEYIYRLWDRLTGPSEMIKEANARRQAQLLSSLLISVVPIGMLGAYLQYLIAAPSQKDAASNIMFLIAGIAVVMFFVYVLSRTRYYYIVAVSMVGFAIVAVSIAVLLHPYPLNVESILFYIVPVILAGTFLRFRWAAISTVITLVAALLVGRMLTGIDFQTVVVEPIGILTLCTIILLASYRSRSLMEGDRQRELAQREARYRGLFESAFEAFAIYDGSIILEHNSGFARMFGYSPYELVGLPLSIFIAPQSMAVFKDKLTSESTQPFEVMGQKKDGGPMYIEATARSYTHNSERANLIAVRDITHRKQFEAQLRASLEEKEVLLKEIHHRVKNNLQIISSLLSLQAADLKDANLLAQYQDSQDRIRSMALIHERLYRSSDLAHIDFGNYLQDLTSSLVQTYRQQARGITLQISTAPVLLDIDTAVPCGLIVNELVSNALKHAFCDGQGGVIAVELRADPDDRLSLTVKDDGVGFPEDLDYRKTASLGLQLVNSLAHQLGGTVELRGGVGTEFAIHFQQTSITKTHLKENPL